MEIPDRFVDGMPKYASLVRSTAKSHRLLYVVACWLLLLVLLTARSANGADHSSGTLALLTTTPETLTATVTTQGETVILFSTPPPVRVEEPLAGGNRDFPSVFPGVKIYSKVQATLDETDLSPSSATSLAKAALAVVKIRGCDNAGCPTAGSGVLVHPSGLILTAYHVLLTDPDDFTSSRYPDFVIAMTTNPRTAPQPRYRARLVAQKADQDLALLMIDRDQAGTALASDQIELPALPLADIANLFGEALPILGYPVNGGEAISFVPANFSGFDDGGRLIVVDRALDSGTSGGPAVVEQAGHFAIAGIVVRRRSTQGQLSQEGLLRAIDQLDTLTWAPKMARAWGEAVQANVQPSNDGDLLQFMLTLNTLDLRAQSLRLLFYATDAATDQPWQPANASAPLVLWADVPPQQVIERRALTLTVPVASLGTTPDRLRFHALLWDTAQGYTLWTDTSSVQAAPGAVALVPTATPTMAPTPTPHRTATSQQTAPQVPTAIPTATAASTSTATNTSAPTSTAIPTLSLTRTPTTLPRPTDTLVSSTPIAFLYDDEFSGPSLNSRWHWIHEGQWTLNPFSGKLRLIATKGDMALQCTTHTNLLLQNAPSGNFEIETTVSLFPTSNYQQGGLLIFSDADNYLKLDVVYAHSEHRDGVGVELFLEEDGQFPAAAESWPWENIRSSAGIFLKIERSKALINDKDFFVGMYSYDGTTWKTIGTQASSNISNPQVGIFALAGFIKADDCTGEAPDIPVDFDYFRLRLNR